MSNFVKSINGLSKVWKLVLCIPGINLIWGIWRICVAVKNNSAIQLVLAIVMLFVGTTVLWILDIVFIILGNYPFWFK